MNTRKNSSMNNFPTALLVIAIACFFIFLVAKMFAGNNPDSSETSTGTTSTGLISTGTTLCSTEDISEVCGSDGITYGNACFAEKANVTEYTAGKCKETTTSEETTTSTGTNANACTREYDPVCGTDGITYGNSCLAENAQVKVASFGACKTKTPETTATGATQTPTTTVTTTTPITPKNTTTTSSTGETITNSTSTGTTVTALPSDSTDTTSSSKLAGYDTAKYHHYQNTSVGYSFAIPKNTSYQGFGAQNGATHTLGISTTGELTDLASSSVQVYYYATTPANPPANSKAVTLTNGATVYITSNNSPGTDNIVNTVIASIEKN